MLTCVTVQCDKEDDAGESEVEVQSDGDEVETFGEDKVTTVVDGE